MAPNARGMNRNKHVVSYPVTFSDAGSTPAASTNYLSRSFGFAQDFGSGLPLRTSSREAHASRGASLTPANRLKFNSRRLHHSLYPRGFHRRRRAPL